MRDPACVSLSVYVCISDFFYVLENFTGGVTSIARQSSTGVKLKSRNVPPVYRRVLVVFELEKTVCYYIVFIVNHSDFSLFKLLFFSAHLNFKLQKALIGVLGFWGLSAPHLAAGLSMT